jgi:acetyl-CoA carboxylase alpha subunit
MSALYDLYVVKGGCASILFRVEGEAAAAAAALRVASSGLDFQIVPVDECLCAARVSFPHATSCPAAPKVGA